MSCRLIINADDFGWSEGVNRAVCALYDEGIVTSTSLMLAAPAAPAAVELARKRAGLAVGLHMVLVHGPALLPHHEVPQLTDSRGWFSLDCTAAALRYTFIPACRQQLRRELQAQFRTFDALGLGWSHVDSHLHFAVVPAFFRAALALAEQYRPLGYRLPEDDSRLYARMDPADAARQRVHAAWFRGLCSGQRRQLESRGFVTTRFCYGFFRTGRLDSTYLSRLIHEMPDGDFELHCHPSLSTEAGRGEFEALRSREFRTALSERGVELATYGSLHRSQDTPDRWAAEVDDRPVCRQSSERW